MGADTVSLDPQYEETTLLFDRTFQKYSIDHSIYFAPIDETEDERQNIEDDVLNGAFENQLFFGELVQDPVKVLDLGYGQAHWSIEVAEKYPQCEVTAIDIRPLDLAFFPSNLSLECDNLNHNLTEVYPIDSFSVIQSRHVCGGIQVDRWPSYLAEIRQLLAPTGFAQACEYYFNFQSHSGMLNASSALSRWSDLYRQAMERLHRDPRAGNNMLKLFRAAGFANIGLRYFDLPIGAWPTDERQRSIGQRNLENVQLMLESFALWPMVQALGMSPEAVRHLCHECRAELDGAQGLALKAYLPCTVVWGSKGGDDNASGS